METIIIITGHGNYGTGIKSNLSFIIGEQRDVYAVDFLDNQTEADLVTAYQSIITSYVQPNVIFVCDLLGGTPFRAAASIAARESLMQVVCGCGVGALIEILSIKNTMSSNDIATALVNKTKEYCVRFEMPQQKPSEYLDRELGI